MRPRRRLRFVQLTIHIDPERLKGARGRVDAVSPRRSQDTLHKRRQCARRLKRFFGTVIGLYDDRELHGEWWEDPDGLPRLHVEYEVIDHEQGTRSGPIRVHRGYSEAFDALCCVGDSFFQRVERKVDLCEAS